MADTDADQTFAGRTDYAFNPAVADALNNAGTPEGDETTSPYLAPPPSLAKSPGTNPQTAFSDPAYLYNMMEQDRKEREEERTASRAERAELIKAQRENTAAGVAELNAGMEQLRSIPKPDLEKAPQSPKANMAQGAMEWMQFAAVLGALGGALSRGNATVAMNAFGSAIKGFTQGKLQAFETGVEEWKTAVERMREDNQTKMDLYKQVWQDTKLDMDQKMAMRKLIAQQYQDEIGYNLADHRDYQQSAQYDTRMEQLMFMGNLKADKLAADTESVRVHTDFIKAFGTGRGTEQQLAFQKAKDFEEQNGRPPNGEERQKIINDVKAQFRESTTIAARSGNLAIAAREVQNFAPNLKAISDATPRNGIAKLNELTNEWEVQKGDAVFAAFISQINTMIGIYSTIITRGAQSTDAARAQAAHILNPNDPTTAFNSKLNQIVYDAKGARASAAQAQGEVGTNPQMPTAPVPGAPYGGDTASDDEIAAAKKRLGL